MVFIPTETGHWVDENFERLARVIQDYDPNLELRWIPPEHRAGEKPYRIIDVKHNYVVFDASETDSPQMILERLFAGDVSKGNPLKRMEAREAAEKTLKLKEAMDQAEEAADQATFLKNSPLHTLRFNGKKFDHNRRRIE